MVFEGGRVIPAFRSGSKFRHFSKSSKSSVKGQILSMAGKKEKETSTKKARSNYKKGKKGLAGHSVTIGVGFGLLLSLVVLWVILYYRPTLNQIHRVGGQVRRWGSMMRMSSIPESKVKTLETDVSQLESDIASIEKKIYPIGEMPQIGKAIIRLGRRHNLVMIAMTPSYDVLFPVNSLSTRKKPLVKLPVTFIIRGRYFDIGRFLEDIPKLPFAFAVDEVSMETAPDVYPNINIQLKGYFFLLTKDAKFAQRKQEPTKKAVIVRAGTNL